MSGIEGGSLDLDGDFLFNVSGSFSLSLGELQFERGGDNGGKIEVTSNSETR